MPQTCSTVGVVFVFSCGGKEITRETMREGEPPRTVEINGKPVEIGVFVDLVPGESGSLEEFQEISIPKANGVPISVNRDAFPFGGLNLEEIKNEDSIEEKKRKFLHNKHERASSITCRAILLIPPLKKRQPHPKGKLCGECEKFNRTRGQAELLEITHVYQNGSFAMSAEIVKAMCDLHGKPNLTKDIVGHCPLEQALVADTTPACNDFEELEAQLPEAVVVGRREARQEKEDKK